MSFATRSFSPNSNSIATIESPISTGTPRKAGPYSASGGASGNTFTERRCQGVNAKSANIAPPAYSARVVSNTPEFLRVGNSDTKWKNVAGRKLATTNAAAIAISAKNSVGQCMIDNTPKHHNVKFAINNANRRCVARVGSCKKTNTPSPLVETADSPNKSEGISVTS